jgi:hypothetical protein
LADRSDAPLDSVEIELGGERLELQSSLHVCAAVSALHGGLAATAQSCDQWDFQTVCTVVVLGLGFEADADKVRRVRNRILRAGVISVAAECLLFIRTLAHGGRTPPDAALGQEG